MGSSLFTDLPSVRPQVPLEHNELTAVLVLYDPMVNSSAIKNKDHSNTAQESRFHGLCPHRLVQGFDSKFAKYR